jgi:hypothetical protein
MPSLGSRAAFTVSMTVALFLVIAGLFEILSAAGSTLLGIVLIILAFGISGHAKKARAAYLHQQKMAGLWEWAQGLGPRKGQGRGRPW